MPTITIFGATGSQGSSVLEAVLADGKYTPRAVSRSLDSEASKALIAKGVEVVVGDLWNKESIKKAIRGSDAVFGITSRRREITQGKNLVDAAKEVGIQFFIWSSLPNATRDSKGRYSNLYHVDNKAIIEDYVRASGVPFAVLLTGWFLENLWKFGSLSKTDTGYTIPIPKYALEDEQVGTWVAHDLGAAAVGLLTHYSDASKGVLGKSYPVITARFTYPELAAAVAKAIKTEVTFSPIPSAGLAELDEMFEYQAKIGMYSGTPVPNPDLVALGVKFATLEEFVKKEVVPRFA
ncbi:NAD(P)-binding protein [Mycena polygramma]|nr:NAD(P)-binding protein [Mycena polygramma]